MNEERRGTSRHGTEAFFMEPDSLSIPDFAHWIWGNPVDTRYYPTNTYWKFRRDFAWERGDVYLWITASTRYQLFLNGHLVGEGPSPCDPEHQVVDRHDLGAFLCRGTNRLAVLVHHCGMPTFNYIPARGGLLAWSEGLDEEMGTDGDWWVARADEWNPYAEKRAMQLVQSEIVDMRRHETDWQIRDPDLGKRFSNNYGAFWGSAYMLSPEEAGEWKGYVKRSIPFLRLGERVEARRLVRAARVRPSPDPWDVTHLAKQIEREIPEMEGEAEAMRVAFAAGEEVEIPSDEEGDTVLLFDLGSYVCGYFILEAVGGEGAAVDISAGEALFRNWVNPRFPHMPTANFVHRVILVEGENTWRSFYWGAARYLQVTVRPSGNPVRLRRVGMIPSGYPLESVGSFRSGDPMLDWLWQVGADTVQFCYHELVTDCPTREQAQWVEHVSAPVCWAVFGDPHLVRKMLIQVAEGEMPGQPGCLRTPWPASIPCQSVGARWTNLPDQQMVWLDLVCQHDTLFDDQALVERLFPVVEKVVAYHRSGLNEEGLLDQRKFSDTTWFWIDWEHTMKRGEIGSLNFLYVSTLRSCAQLAERVGREDLALHWRNEAESLGVKAREVFFDSEVGMFCEDREHRHPSRITTIMAVRAGVCRVEEISKILRRALAPPPEADRGGTHFLIYMLPVYLRHGLGKEVLGWMRDKYAEMYALRVPALWENFSLGAEIQAMDDFVPRAGESQAEEHVRLSLHRRSGESRCHAYSAAPTAVLSRYVVGVRPAEAGSRAVVIEPRMDLLDACEAVVMTGRYPVRVAWKREGSGQTHLQWEAPKEVSVTVLPWKKDAPSRGELSVRTDPTDPTDPV